jgi:hypothetical protein
MRLDDEDMASDQEAMRRAEDIADLVEAEEELESQMGEREPEKVKWLSETVCDFCGRDCRDVGKTFIDGKTDRGPWGLMCSNCGIFHSVGLGTGRGQRYDSKTLEKVEG